jgi:hypothetical protein
MIKFTAANVLIAFECILKMNEDDLVNHSQLTYVQQISYQLSDHITHCPDLNTLNQNGGDTQWWVPQNRWILNDQLQQCAVKGYEAWITLFLNSFYSKYVYAHIYCKKSKIFCSFYISDMYFDQSVWKNLNNLLVFFILLI